MARQSPSQHQLSLGPTLLNKVATDGDDLKKVENVAKSIKNVENEAIFAANRAAGELLEAARIAAGLTRKESCALMFIDEAQYSRWASGNGKDTPSFARLLLLPPAFHIELHRAMNSRFGFGRAALRRVIDDLGSLALLAEAR